MPQTLTPEILDALDDCIMYHNPGPGGVESISLIRDATKNLIRVIMEQCPESRDRSQAVRHAREAMMNANASVVLEGRNFPPQFGGTSL